MTRALVETELAAGGDPKAARAALARSREEVLERGYAVIDGSVVPGLRAIAGPILDIQGDLRACMALVSPSEALVR
ncbi:hypothetical protein NL489_30370, partial [Klebsiella pneumoniae]|nr:hypothetical protein [Klebsiella pneumoniae]